MGDGLGEYHHDPVAWAVGTVIEGNVDIEGRTAEDLVQSVWDFIVACFDDESLPLPDRSLVISGVRARLQEISADSGK